MISVLVAEAVGMVDVKDKEVKEVKEVEGLLEFLLPI